MNKEMVYVSGPLSGQNGTKSLDHNLKAEVSSALNYQVQHPDASLFLPGQNFLNVGPALNWGWKEYMRPNLIILKKADTVFMRKDWQDSRGAKIEHRLSKWWKKLIVYE